MSNDPTALPGRARRGGAPSAHQERETPVQDNPDTAKCSGARSLLSVARQRSSSAAGTRTSNADALLLGGHPRDKVLNKNLLERIAAVRKRLLRYEKGQPGR